METNLAIAREEVEKLEADLRSVAAEIESGKILNEAEKADFDNKADMLVQTREKVESLSRVERAKEWFTSKKAPLVKVSNAITKRDRNNALKAWVFNDTECWDLLKPQNKDSLMRSCDLMDADYTVKELLCRDQTSDVTTEGGFTMSELHLQLTEAKKSHGGLEPYAYSFNTPSGNTLHVSHVDDTATLGAISVQAPTAPSSQDYTFARTSFGAYPIRTQTFPISYELFEDSEADLESFFVRNAAERINRRKSYYLVNGSGSSEPGGVKVSPITGVYGNTNAITAAKIWALYFSIDKAYRDSPSCAWFMHDYTVYSLIASLETEDNVPLWQGLTSGPNMTLCGKPVIVCNEMDTMVDGVYKLPIGFGDLKSLWIRNVNGIKFVKTDRYNDQYSVGVHATFRFDSAVVNPHTTAGEGPIKFLQTGSASGGD